MLKRMSCNCFLLAALALLGLTTAAEAKVVYVAPGGSGDGSSWTSPKGTIASGLAASVSGDQIWVKQGTYNEAIALKPGVNLYGGFAGSETQLTERNWSINTTTINATGKGADVVRGANNATIDGFTLTGGQGTLSGSYRYGGGVYCSSSSSPTITNCTISGNSASYGGGVYCSNSSPTITNCVISANSGGGGVYCYGSSPTITNCTISGNSDYHGGGVYCDYSSPTITNCVISGNWASSYGGGVYCSSSSPTITNPLSASIALSHL